MPAELEALLACLTAAAVTLLLTPLTIRLAHRIDMLDRPREYRAHAAPTPYLGGAALMGGFAIATLVWSAPGRFWAPLLCALGLAALGTLDDARPVRPRYRVLAELAAAGVLTATATGWTFPANDVETFLLNAAWVVGFTNAFNLMDNMDGAAATVGATCSAWIGAFALMEGDGALAALALALAGASCGFLRFNLRLGGGRRAAIFLGDGGSMPLGFVAAVAAANVPYDSGLGGGAMLLAGSLLLAIPVLDTLLVTVSRTRRGISILTGGRDHLTHRLCTRLRSPARVAFVLAMLQSSASAAALVTAGAGRTAVVVTAAVCFALGLVLVALLERPVFLVREPARASDIGARQLAQVDVDTA